MAAAKQGLYANIHAKQERIAHGSGETMRKPGSKGAPSAHAFEESAKTEKTKKTSTTAGSRRPAASSSTKRASSSTKKRASSGKPSSH